jgi:hypothetical protein
MLLIGPTTNWSAPSSRRIPACRLSGGCLISTLSKLRARWDQTSSEHAVPLFRIDRSLRGPLPGMQFRKCLKRFRRKFGPSRYHNDMSHLLMTRMYASRKWKHRDGSMLRQSFLTVTGGNHRPVPVVRREFVERQGHQIISLRLCPRSRGHSGLELQAVGFRGVRYERVRKCTSCRREVGLCRGSSVRRKPKLPHAAASDTRIHIPRPESPSFASTLTLHYISRVNFRSKSINAFAR